MTSFQDDPAYLRARVAELEKAVASLRARLIALTRVLPPDYVQLLCGNAANVEAGAPNWSVLDGWEDSTVIEPSSVKAEMERLWARIGPRSDDFKVR